MNLQGRRGRLVGLDGGPTVSHVVYERRMNKEEKKFIPLWYHTSRAWLHSRYHFHMFLQTDLLFFWLLLWSFNKMQCVVLDIDVKNS